MTTINPRTIQDSPLACLCGGTEETTSNAETLLSSNAKFQAISALTVSPDGVLHIADQGLNIKLPNLEIVVCIHVICRFIAYISS